MIHRLEVEFDKLKSEYNKMVAEYEKKNERIEVEKKSLVSKLKEEKATLEKGPFHFVFKEYQLKIKRL